VAADRIKHSKGTLDSGAPGDGSAELRNPCFSPPGLNIANEITSMDKCFVMTSTPQPLRFLSILRSNMDATPVPPASIGQADRNISSTVEGSEASAANEVRAEPYRFNFGMHRGKLLDETPPSYIQWIIRENIAAGRSDLKEALDQYKSRAATNSSRASGLIEARDALQSNNPSSSAPASARIQADWIVPRLSHAPSRFRDFGEDLWICNRDTRRYFSLSAEEISRLPLVSKNPEMGRERYWLYHVWDLARVRRGKKGANEGLGQFLGRQRERIEKVWDEMGLTVWDNCDY
jgi:hypothetical protein